MRAPLLAFMLGLTTTVAQAQTSLDQTALYAEFITEQQNQGISMQETQNFLMGAQYNQAVIDAISKPWEAKPWHQYYPIFLTPERLQAGLAFWKQHHAIIQNVAKTYQVDPQVIVAIIGIETYYGGNMGKHSVRDALYTLGFNYPPRADFFRKELANLQHLVREERLDVNSLKGSYAGAMGYGQFIPSSYRHYAVDYDKDGRRDLLNNPGDAIASVANYLKEHGWQYGMPAAVQLLHTTTPAAKPWAGEKMHLQVKDILRPELSLLHAYDMDVHQPALLVELDQPQTKEYWLGLNNFYVITRYNRSPLYSMAVFLFSEQLRNAYTQ